MVPFVIVAMVKVLDREPKGSKYSIKPYRQWMIAKGNLDMRSLISYRAATE
jgi:hypothetical protein